MIVLWVGFSVPPAALARLVRKNPLPARSDFASNTEKLTCIRKYQVDRVLVTTSVEIEK